MKRRDFIKNVTITSFAALFTEPAFAAYLDSVVDFPMNKLYTYGWDINRVVRIVTTDGETLYYKATIEELRQFVDKYSDKQAKIRKQPAVNNMLQQLKIERNNRKMTMDEYMDLVPLEFRNPNIYGLVVCDYMDAM